MSARALRRLALAGAAGAAVLFALPTAAGAHVNASGVTVDGTTTVTLTFDHGCEGNPTTSLRVLLPDGATSIEPQDPAGWTSAVSGTEVAWTGGEIANGARGTFVLTASLVEPEGSTVFLPTVQGCTGGTEEAWIDKSDDPGADAAAPRITAGAGVATTVPTTAHDSGTFGSGDDHGGDEETTLPSGDAATTGAAPTTTMDDHGESDSASPATENASHSSSSNAPLIIGIIAAVVVIAGIIAVVVSRRGSATSDT